MGQGTIISENCTIFARRARRPPSAICSDEESLDVCVDSILHLNSYR